MARVLVVGVEGRQVAGKDNKPGRFFGKVHLVRGRAVTSEGVVGVQVSTVECGESEVIRQLSQNVPGFFDLDSMVVAEYGENREKILGVDYLGDERKFVLSSAGIFSRVAAKVSGAGVPAESTVATR
jgi:hypothetical protein